MQKPLNEKVEIAIIKGQVAKLVDPHLNAGAEKFRSSDFLASLNLLAEGECDNPNKKLRNALVAVTDLSTGTLKGTLFFPLDSRFSWLLLLLYLSKC